MRREPHPYLRGELVVVIDCSDLARSAEFWAGVLGYARDGVASGRYQTLLPADGRGAEILLQQVDDGKHGKNRVHLDLRTRDLEPELHRLISLWGQGPDAGTGQGGRVDMAHPGRSGR
jgi:Glyoxalase-like domain